MYNSINSDLIRGHIDTIILKSLFASDRYGYEICKEIESCSGGQYELKQPTLYSCLKRLENQGFISSYWGERSKGSRRKYYTLTELGRDLFLKNQTDWEYSRTVIDRLISDRKFDLESLTITKDIEDVGESFIDDDEIINDETSIDNIEETINNEISDDNEEVINDEISDEIEEIKTSIDDTVNNDSASNNLLNEVAITLSVEEEDTDENVEVDDDSYEPPTLSYRSYFDSIVSNDNTNPVATNEDVISAKFQSFNDELAALSEQENKEYEQAKTTVTEVEKHPKEELQAQSKKGTAQPFSFFDFDYNNTQASTVKTPPKTFARQEKDYKNSINRILRGMATEAESSTKSNSTEKPPEEPKLDINDDPPYTANFIFGDQTSRQENNEFDSEKSNNTGFDTDSKNNAKSSDKAFNEPPHYDFDFTADEKMSKTERDSILFDVNPIDFSDKTTKIRTHTKGIARQYNSQFYIYSNKLRFFNLLITGMLMLIETFTMIIFFNKLGLGTFGANKSIYLTAISVPLIMIGASFIAYQIQPERKQRAQFNFLNNIIFWAIVFVFSVIFIFSLNLALDMRITNYMDYMVRMLVPMVLSTNFLINSIVYYALYKSKKFAV